MSTRRPGLYDERLARLFAALDEARALFERHAAIMASSQALLGEAEAALERSRRVRERLAREAHPAGREPARGERPAPDA